MAIEENAAPLPPGRALITGVGGFTGAYVAQALAARGFEVHGTVHGTEAHATHAHVTAQYALDLCDRAQVAQVVAQVQPHVVVHLAAIAFVAHGDAEAMYRVNLLGTRNLLQALAELPRPPQAVLLASSANVYGNAFCEVLDEQVPPAPANDYAVSKLAMEYLARLWLDKLSIMLVRPFNYTGVGQSPQFLLPKIVGHFQRRATVIELGNVDVWRDFSDVRTVAQAYASLIEKPAPGEIFNICSGQAYSLREVLGLMAQIAGHEIEVRVNPAFVRVQEVQRLQGDARKLWQHIGPLPTITLRETLEWMYRGGRF
ncbi:MAG: GDP-mannose 4,6-dehydratase [Pseudomonadota bacterium]